jgi:hypothetical protein
VTIMYRFIFLLLMCLLSSAGLRKRTFIILQRNIQLFLFVAKQSMERQHVVCNKLTFSFALG